MNISHWDLLASSIHCWNPNSAVNEAACAPAAYSHWLARSLRLLNSRTLAHQVLSVFSIARAMFVNACLSPALRAARKLSIPRQRGGVVLGTEGVVRAQHRLFDSGTSFKRNIVERSGNGQSGDGESKNGQEGGFELHVAVVLWLSNER